MKTAATLFILDALVSGIFAPLVPPDPYDDSIYNTLDDLDEARGTFISHPEQHVAPSSWAATPSPPRNPAGAKGAHGNPQQWDNLQRATPTEQNQHQHWNNIPQPAPPSSFTQGPGRFNADSMAPWQTHVDRNPDDLSAIVYGNKGKSPVLGTGGASHGRWIAGSGPPQIEEPHLPVQPASHHAISPEWEPTLHVQYNPAPLQATISKSRLDSHFGDLPEPRAFSDDELETVEQNLKSLLRAWHTFNEYIFNGRRFLILLLPNQGDLQLNDLRRAASVWEFKTDGQKTVMLCRGVWGIAHSYWKKFESVKPPRSYYVRIGDGTPGPSNQMASLNRLEIADSRLPSVLLPPADRKTSARGGKEITILDPVLASRFFYRRQEGIQEPFMVWLEKNLAHTSFDPKTHQEALLPEDRDQPTKELHVVFEQEMRESFKRRKTVGQLELNGQSLFITHHVGSKLPILRKPFASLWKSENDGETHLLVSVGLFPLTRSPFDTAIIHSKIPNRRFHRLATSKQLPGDIPYSLKYAQGR
ncbi:conserved hypothetical Ustilaginaceae-specific protein [Sporisorium reilianum SRZ2]|uniref:Conserved hypothetical Ustilaginaceae-specific protein n=1 Tax=Sporisorium reilianum (strain SRZ2) TaxID=999809 RepID=E7A3B6_SPORE|nr:conserved hypothetical Ustilaginaceae-specific protein [Sporisorium reilianum SRZ2]